MERDKRQGVFIVIEGMDGSGKSTQFELLKERLQENGYAVAAFDFPRYDQPSSYFVQRYLGGAYGQADDVGPYTSSLFYALDRFEAAPEIRRALSEGKVVICNRYTGSSMAHQGTKLLHAEERRGFFIWLDNLEFEMLRIPRPDICFVLRVPADTAHQLAARRGPTDVHESNLDHLERTAIVYDDMTQLFPKDFQRIDCVRGGKLLEIDAVQAMLWEKINPLLPPPGSQTTAPPVAGAPNISQTPEQPVKDDAFVLENVSGLVAQKIERLAPGALVHYAETPTVYVPENLIPAAREEYQKHMQELLAAHAKLVNGLQKEGAEPSVARQTASAVLPVALAAATIRLALDAQRLEELIVALLNDELPEAQAAGANLLAQALSTEGARDQLKASTAPVSRKAYKAVQALAEELLTQNHVGQQPAVRLTGVWPRNELDLVPDMLYAHTGLPLGAIQERTARWPLDQKLAIFEAYLASGHLGPVLEKVHYNWDMQCSYAVFRELQKYSSEDLEIQQLTPRHGYDVPKLIEDAGLADAYEACFDLSLALYSSLQQAGHHLEAQYATLHGHNQRWKCTLSASQAARLVTALGLTPEAQNLLQKLHQTLAEAHPTIGESLMPKQ